MKHTDLNSWVVQALSCAARAVSIPSRRRFAAPVRSPFHQRCCANSLYAWIVAEG